MSQNCYSTDHVKIFIRQRVSDSLPFKDYEYELLVSPTTGYVCQPIKKNELKELADFIYKIIEDNNQMAQMQNFQNIDSFVDTLPMEPRGPFLS